MMVALAAWLLALSLVLTGMFYALTRQRVAYIAVLAILLVHLFIRPGFYFFGLDQPYPYNFFDNNSWQLITTATLIGIGWVVLFSLSYAVLSAPAAMARGLLPQAPINADRNAVLFIAIAVTGLAALATAAKVVEYGSIARFVFAVKVSKELAGSFVLKHISVIGAIITIFGMFLFARPVSNHTSRWLRTVPIVIFVLCMTLFCINAACNFMWGNRYNIALLTFTLALGWHFYVRPFRISEIILGVICLGLILQMLKGVRADFRGEASNTTIESTQSLWLSISTSLHFNQFDAFMLALRDMGTLFDMREGKDFYNGLVSWIPRSLMPDKETFYIGSWFRRIYEPAHVNGWPVSVVGSWYVNFGAIGIIAGAILSGFVAAIFDQAFRAVRQSAWQAAMAPGLAFFMLDGGVNTGFPQQIVLTLIPLTLLAMGLHLTSRNPVYITRRA